MVKARYFGNEYSLEPTLGRVEESARSSTLTILTLPIVATTGVSNGWTLIASAKFGGRYRAGFIPDVDTTWLPGQVSKNLNYKIKSQR